MNKEKLYVSKVLPHLANFKVCNIYRYEIKKIEQELAESFNKNNIHEVLDIPDFRHVKNDKLMPEIIKLVLNKLKIEKNTLLQKKDFIVIDGIEYK
ncbi:hypothetical protein [Psychroflexus sp. MBR-150]|jgi:hypothetical protein